MGAPSIFAHLEVRYCGVFNGLKKLQSYNGGDDSLESLADAWLPKFPSLHTWYFHRSQGRACGFMKGAADGMTYFAIAHRSFSNQNILEFLGRVCDRLNSGEEFSHIIQRLIPSSQNAKELAASDNEITTTATDMTTTPNQGNDVGENHHAITVTPVDYEVRHRRYGRLMCSRQLRLFISLDILVCLMLILAWLSICHGTHCIFQH